MDREARDAEEDIDIFKGGMRVLGDDCICVDGVK